MSRGSEISVGNLAKAGSRLTSHLMTRSNHDDSPNKGAVIWRYKWRHILSSLFLAKSETSFALLVICLMESLSIGISTCLLVKKQPQTHRSSSKFILRRCSTTVPCNSIQLNYPKTGNLSHVLQTEAPIHLFQQISPKLYLSLLCMSLSFPLTSLASETTIPTPTKINIEAILVSIDEFFNNYPFFVAGVTFMWLVLIPLAEEYLQKYKFTSAVDAFGKLRDDPTSHLLDIRDDKSLAYLPSPSLRMFNKSVMQVEFRQGDEDAFLKRVFQNLNDPQNTTLCVIDNFDGNSIKVAELLVKNGLKEAYAIRGGIRGKKGWQEIQEILLPPSVHIYTKKKVKGQQPQDRNNGVIQANEINSQSPSAIGVTQVEQISNGSIKKSADSTSAIKCGPRSSSPYPNYPDLKPPSSPSPSKPQN
ncbi:rhodanese-like domain-containing protein 4A, chloroplastic [Solanum dulcamara]|uniref:rhodanese-like domain-containing protein 4A, chloroplastic n=1 Tax=Solanum dulcamara TaxID=45834 RepID=UPI0024855287|nr:rhodanese-like domain-containing protein 4A, chloroplastic [Solanum dulcamara]